MRMILASVALTMGAAVFFVLLVLSVVAFARPQPDPCASAAPRPVLHASDSDDGGFSIATQCPKGWDVKQKLGHNGMTQAEAINTALEATCAKAK